MPPFMLAVRLSRSHLTGPEPGPEPKNSVQNRKVKSEIKGCVSVFLRRPLFSCCRVRTPGFDRLSSHPDKVA